MPLIHSIAYTIYNCVEKNRGLQDILATLKKVSLLFFLPVESKILQFLISAAAPHTGAPSASQKEYRIGIRFFVSGKRSTSFDRGNVVRCQTKLLSKLVLCQSQAFPTLLNSLTNTLINHFTLCLTFLCRL